MKLASSFFHWLVLKACAYCTKINVHSIYTLAQPTCSVNATNIHWVYSVNRPWVMQLAPIGREVSFNILRGRMHSWTNGRLWTFQRRLSAHSPKIVCIDLHTSRIILRCSPLGWYFSCLATRCQNLPGQAILLPGLTMTQLKEGRKEVDMYVSIGVKYPTW